MAIVKVYNRDGSEYGELNTSAYIFNNELVGFEPTKFDVNLYPYIKVNGVYYKNDGEEFYSRGRADNSSALMEKADCYKVKGSRYENHISLTTAEPNNKKHNSSIAYEAMDAYNSKLFMIKVPNYNIKGKAICGSVHTSHVRNLKDYKYGVTFNNQKEPDFWNLIPGSPRVLLDTTQSTRRQ